MFLAAGFLFLHNSQEAADADRVAQEKLSQLVVQIGEKQKQQNDELQNPEVQEPTASPSTESVDVPDVTIAEPMPTEPVEMDEIEIEGDRYIGYLSFPRFELELPVMSDWSDSKLQVSPCRFRGNLATDDLVIMAHNFARHFGQISDLATGDVVLFTDVNGNTTEYEVVAREILPPDALADMTAGKFDLTLFTCTYGGASRITVRCDRKAPN